MCGQVRMVWNQLLVAGVNGEYPVRRSGRGVGAYVCMVCVWCVCVCMVCVCVCARVGG